MTLCLFWILTLIPSTSICHWNLPHIRQSERKYVSFSPILREERPNLPPPSFLYSESREEEEKKKAFLFCGPVSSHFPTHIMSSEKVVIQCNGLHRFKRRYSLSHSLSLSLSVSLFLLPFKWPSKPSHTYLWIAQVMTIYELRFWLWFCCTFSIGGKNTSVKKEGRRMEGKKAENRKLVEEKGMKRKERRIEGWSSIKTNKFSFPSFALFATFCFRSFSVLQFSFTVSVILTAVVWWICDHKFPKFSHKNLLSGSSLIIDFLTLFHSFFLSHSLSLSFYFSFFLTYEFCGTNFVWMIQV